MKHTKRLLSLFLAILMVFGVLPFSAFANDSTSTPTEWTDEDYNALYVTDADHDDEDDRIFFWDAFDLKSGDGAVTKLVNQLNSAQSVALTTAVAGDGYVATLDKLNLSSFFQSFAKTVNHEGSDVLVLQDTTLEMVMFQNKTQTYENGEVWISLPPVGNFKMNTKAASDNADASFISKTYGAYSALNGGSGQITFDVTDGSWESRNTVVLGNQRGADHTFTFGIRHTYDIPSSGIEGTLTFDFLRDGKVPTNGSHATTYEMLYDARYRGDFKKTITTATNIFTFGGLDFAYRAIRIYDVALTEAQMAQNHAADLFKYYKIDVTAYLSLNANKKAELHEALASLQIGDADAKEKIELLIQESDNSSTEPGFDTYDQFYIIDADGDGNDDRIFFWDAFNLKSGDGAVTKLVNQLNSEQSIALTTATAGDGYVATLDKLDVSAFYKSFAKTVKYEDSDVLVLQDATWEMVIFQNTTQTYTTDLSHNKVAIAPLNELSIQYWHANDDASASFVKQTYGICSPVVGTDNQVAFDVVSGWADRNTVVLGNQRGADHTYTYGIRHTFNVPEGAIEGTLTLDFVRDGKVPTNGKHATSYEMFYDARYKGDFKKSVTAATNSFTFGGLDFAYRAIRIYDVALTEAQMAQNHAADLFKYYQIDVADYVAMDSATKQTVHEALSSVQIGDADAKERIELLIQESGNSSTNPGFDAYDQFYVIDADGDKIDDRIFFWDAFDLKAGDGAASSLVNRLNPEQKISLTGTAGDGYVASTSVLNFSTFYQSFAKTVTYEGADVLVLQDSTLEMVMFQNTTKTYTAKAEQWTQLAPIGNFKLAARAGDLSSSFMHQTYGNYSTLQGGTGTVAFDDTSGSWAERNTEVLGNTRGANHTFTYAIRHNFTVPENAISGTLTLDFMRDGKVPTNGKHATSYEMLYDARYKGNFKSSATAANNSVTFGGFDFAYRAIRIYDVALTEAQMAQNHFVDIAKQLELDLSSYALCTDDVIKEVIHDLVKDRNASAFVAEDLQMQIDLLVAGGKEYLDIKDAVRFEGYSVRLYGDAGMRALFLLDRASIEASKNNTDTLLKEIGVIVANKGDYTVEDLTVAGGEHMQKHIAYENNEWTKREGTDENKLIEKLDKDGNLKTYFPVTKLFEDESDKTKENYEAEMLFRGYMIIEVGGNEYVFYTDMTAPTLESVSMRSTSSAFYARGWEAKNIKTVKDVLDTCGVSYEQKIYAAESFLKPDGSIDHESTGDLNIVFVGGSLTEAVSTPAGDKKWVEKIANYLQDEVFPNKNVNWINSGVGGTKSEAAAARFSEHVAPHNPDIIFIEFTVNDDMSDFLRAEAQVYMESFLYQCSLLDKVPTVIYMHTPAATLPGSDVHEKWYRQYEYKEEWAEYYGIETIDIYGYSYGKWEKETKEGATTDDYITWLDQYYATLQDEVVGNNNKYGRYDVHGGYQLYYEAIVEAFEERAEELLEPYRFMPYIHQEQSDKIERTSIVKYNNDTEFFTYSDGWKYYCKEDEEQRTTGNLRIPVSRWEYPFMTNGVHEAPVGESVTFYTDANALTIYYMSVHTNAGSSFEVYVNGLLFDTCSASLEYVQPLISKTVDLKNPNNEQIEVTLKVVAKSGVTDAYARFGSIWLGYNAQ